MSDIIPIIKRMVQATGTRNVTQMLEMCGFSNSSASAWKRRKNIPDGSIARVATHANVRVEWLKTGEGEMKVMEGKPDFYTEQIAEAAIDYKGKSITLSRDEFILLTLFRKLDEANQEELIDIAALKAEWMGKD